MPGLEQSKITGGNLHPNVETPITNQPSLGGSYVQADVNAFVTRFNNLLTVLRRNGVIKT